MKTVSDSEDEVKYQEGLFIDMILSLENQLLTSVCEKEGERGSREEAMKGRWEVGQRVEEGGRQAGQEGMT